MHSTRNLCNKAIKSKGIKLNQRDGKGYQMYQMLDFTGVSFDIGAEYEKADWVIIRNVVFRKDAFRYTTLGRMLAGMLPMRHNIFTRPCFVQRHRLRSGIIVAYYQLVKHLRGQHLDGS